MNPKTVAKASVKRAPVTYWCTRDSDENDQLSPYVDVWMKKPTRWRLTMTGGAVWLGEDGLVTTRHSRAPVDAVRAWGHTVPETDRECLCVNTMGLAPS